LKEPDEVGAPAQAGEGPRVQVGIPQIGNKMNKMYSKKLREAELDVESKFQYRSGGRSPIRLLLLSSPRSLCSKHMADLHSQKLAMIPPDVRIRIEARQVR
jgi:hypothetical protein